MKRTLSFLLLGAALLSLSACGNSRCLTETTVTTTTTATYAK